MTREAALAYLATWGLIGIALFSLFVIFAFRSGLVYTARKEDGTLEGHIPLKGILAMAIIPVGLLGLHLVSDYVGLVQREIPLDFWPLFLINFSVYVILFVFDTLIIDGFVITIWRPTFLRIPDVMERESMKKHILVSLPAGLFIGAFLTIINTSLAYLLWMNN
jgi:hypothetical protein